MDIAHIKAEQRRILAELKGKTARGRRPQPHDSMNKTEAAYWDKLQLQLMCGEVLWFAFECVKFRLAKRCYYTPDFLVMTAECEFRVVEVKGHMEDDAAAKLRMFVGLYPMLPLFIARYRNGEWEYEERKA